MKSLNYKGLLLATLVSSGIGATYGFCTAERAQQAELNKSYSIPIYPRNRCLELVDAFNSKLHSLFGRCMSDVAIEVTQDPYSI